MKEGYDTPTLWVVPQPLKLLKRDGLILAFGTVAMGVGAIMTSQDWAQMMILSCLFVLSLILTALGFWMSALPSDDSGSRLQSLIYPSVLLCAFTIVWEVSHFLFGFFGTGSADYVIFLGATHMFGTVLCMAIHLKQYRREVKFMSLSHYLRLVT